VADRGKHRRPDVTGHIPVLLAESIAALMVRSGKTYIDCTVGGGGHAEAIVKAGGHLTGLDADPQAIRTAQARLQRYKDVTLVNENYINITDVCRKQNLDSVDGVLFDLGMSSSQLESSGRGFSFLKDETLDMRFSPDQAVTASDIVNTYLESDLVRLIGDYGEEWRSNTIAAAIVRSRPIATSGQLAEIIEKAVGKRGRIHPATKTFQALRIAVNQELENLESGLSQAIDLLASGGRVAVISFHSLEDRLVKEMFKKQSSGCICPRGTPVCICGHKQVLNIVNKKVIKPSPKEIASNPRSRSARLRVAQKI